MVSQSEEVVTDASTLTRTHEFKSERCKGWTWSEGATDFVQAEGIVVRWRERGERRWNKNTVLCDEGQTPDSLKAELPAIVLALIQRKS